MKSRVLISGLAILTGTVAVAAATTSANASTVREKQPADLQAQVNEQLRNYPGGVQISPNEVTYKHGRVVLTIPDGRSAAADPCATGAYCFYDGANFTGRKLTFRDCGGWQYLTDYGFGNKTSSWTNATKNETLVYDDDVKPQKLLWTERPGGASANVGTAAYNKADSFLTYCP
ncbi:peptidase inhibitor family I36 protein [Actinomadura yumaensis]|uniref:Peptidase inhibitor family I36 protein n=1 Tax=Actinomadura yumaensis TaxID=111807 RepID=A0ABW2CPJ5_9ACTN